MDDKISRKLKDFYDFDDADLQANRGGKMSEKQTQMIANRNRVFRLVGIIGGGFFILIAVLAAVIWLVAFVLWSLKGNWSGFQAGSLGAAIGVLGAGIAGTLILRYGLSKGNPKFVFKKTQGAVAVEKIHVKSSGSSSGGFTEHQMKVDGVEFVLDDELVGVIKNGEMWAFYYLEFKDGSEGLILSAEEI